MYGAPFAVVLMVVCAAFIIAPPHDGKIELILDRPDHRYKQIEEMEMCDTVNFVVQYNGTRVVEGGEQPSVTIKSNNGTVVTRLELPSSMKEKKTWNKGEGTSFDWKKLDGNGRLVPTGNYYAVAKLSWYEASATFEIY